MKRFLFAAVLASAVAASVQAADSDLNAGIVITSGQMRALAKKLAPAAVDPEPVAALVQRLLHNGPQLMEEGKIDHTLARRTPLDARGGLRDIQADVIACQAGTCLEATSKDLRVDPETGAGQVDEWRYVVSLDGKLISVEHAIEPIEAIAPVAPGAPEPKEDKRRSDLMSPSDASVQKRWKEFSKELLTLGKTVEA